MAEPAAAAPAAEAVLQPARASAPGAGTRAAAVLAVLVPAIAIVWIASVRNGQLFLAGAGIGAALVLGGIGFAGSWRRLAVARDPQGFVATLLLLGLATILFVPVLSSWEGVAPSRAPVGLSLLLGALVFGAGMQLGGGCGSGTVVGAGSRATHSIFALLFFIPGSLLGALHLPWWVEVGPSAAVDLSAVLGVGGAVVLQLAALGAIGYAAVRISGKQLRMPALRTLAGIAAIALLALLILHISGRMWSVTFAYSLWGAKAAELLGADMASYAFWQTPYASAALGQAVLADVTTVTTLGLLAGAAAVGLWRQRPSPAPYSLRQFAAAALGGLLMGYGARLAFGCNIGALLSGTASASLHGWVWFAAAWIGSLGGIALRPRFGMSN